MSRADDRVVTGAQGILESSPVLPASERRRRFNEMAIAAFVVVFFASAVGLVLGCVALRQIERTDERGRGLALAAVVLGWVGTVVFVLAAAAGLSSWLFGLY